MQTIGIVYNPLAEETAQAGEDLAAWLRARGQHVWLGTSQIGRDQQAEVGGCELLLALGGDGTVLRTARLAIPHNIPILGVAMGHLSFMAEVTLEEVRPGLELLIGGGGWYDERSLVQARILRGGQEIAVETALNEVLLSRIDGPHVVHVAVEIDGMPLTIYHADGVMVATATGSTAYALAAGGPVLDPRSHSLVLVTVAGHLTNIPALVLPPDAVITWKLRSRHPLALNIDGQMIYPLEQTDEIAISRSPLACRFARIHPRAHFYETLTRRLRRE
ncbi:MAG: NAD(+)/NADH kinase [Herpetosiphonaceae bacterium]|nr:NAD(+)/NADH kinase [Herpetosiphonaceae bacterium]